MERDRERETRVHEVALQRVEKKEKREEHLPEGGQHSGWLEKFHVVITCEEKR